MSVAVLSLWVIIASRIERAGVVPVRSRRTGHRARTNAVIHGELFILGKTTRLDVAEILAQR